MCVASTLVLVACGGKVGGEGGGGGGEDSGAPGDGGGSESGEPDGGATDGWEPWDGGDPKPDAGPGGCGWGACSPGTACSDGCNECKCVTDGEWACTERYCPDAEPPPPPPCPAYTPSDYSPCPSVGMYCSYSNSCGNQIAAQCVGDPGGKQYWLTKGEPCAGGCPASRPSDGAGCNVATKCSYANGCGGTDTYYCGGPMSYWKSERGPCVTPTCPLYEPPSGSFCAGPIKCEWKNGCGGSNYGYCSSMNTWNIQPGPCTQPLVCPPTLPSPGSYCPAEGPCYYTNSCGSQDKAYCAGPGSSAGWQVSKQPCASCPTTMPMQGSACSTTSRDCAWNNGCGSIAYGYCDPSAGWQIKQPGCNPSCPGTKPVSGAMCSSPGGTSCQYVVSPGSTCQSQCFCADDGRWACVTPPCASTPP